MKIQFFFSMNIYKLLSSVKHKRRNLAALFHTMKVIGAQKASQSSQTVNNDRIFNLCLGV